MSDRFSIAARVRSFRYAFRGLGLLLRSQHNAWIHGAATILVCALGALPTPGPGASLGRPSPRAG